MPEAIAAHSKPLKSILVWQKCKKKFVTTDWEEASLYIIT